MSVWSLIFYSYGWKRIYILSLFVEHMLLGFHIEENQLRTLVLNHIQTLSRVSRFVMTNIFYNKTDKCHYVYIQCDGGFFVTLLP